MTLDFIKIAIILIDINLLSSGIIMLYLNILKKVKSAVIWPIFQKYGIPKEILNYLIKVIYTSYGFIMICRGQLMDSI